MKRKQKDYSEPSTQPQNTIEAFEKIYYSCEDSQLSEEYLNEAEPLIQYVKAKFDVNSIQAVLLSIILEHAKTSSQIFSNHLNISNIRLYSLSDVFDDLVAKKIIWKQEEFNFDGDSVTYGITSRAKTAIINNEVFVPQDLHCNDWEDFFSMLDELYSKRDNDMLNDKLHEQEIKDLCQANPDLEIVKKIEKWSNILSDVEMKVLLLLCTLYVKTGELDVSTREFAFIFDNKIEYRKLCSELERRTSNLFQKGMVEISNNRGMVMRKLYKLTDKAIHEFFPMLKQESVEENHLHSYKKIPRKELFYNEEDQVQVDTLFDLMGGNHLKQIQSRLREAGMRTGVCCLLYGGPGTGKTATVLEIARSCKRDIFQVNLSDMRSMYVGESERLCQAMWDEYNALVEKSRRAPILLLNECDGILTARMNGAQRSVDKMENTLANIFLENMEKQKGIVIATTNLASNLDDAFERRFIYKIRMGKPCLKARQSIWKTMLPKLSDSDLETIAKDYEFSGGQIENIARKYMIDFVLKGEKLTLKNLKRYCQQEHIKKGGESKTIGFTK